MTGIVAVRRADNREGVRRAVLVEIADDGEHEDVPLRRREGDAVHRPLAHAGGRDGRGLPGERITASIGSAGGALAAAASSTAAARGDADPMA